MLCILRVCFLCSTVGWVSEIDYNLEWSVKFKVRQGNTRKGTKENGGRGDWGGADKLSLNWNERSWIGSEIKVQRAYTISTYRGLRKRIGWKRA